MSFPPNGIVLLNKPPGVTSFGALGGLKRALGTGKVGHTGTLDKFADGLLVVLTGKMTKFNPLVTGMDKCYRAEIRFGSETSTLDPEGEIIAEGPVPELEAVEAVLPEFLGTQEQVPPVYSALHVNGKRAHQLARSGTEVDLAPRSVRIDRIQVVSWDSPVLTVQVDCSKGTYIRSLARDIARRCGSAAHLTALRRTSVGAFRLCDAVTVDEFDPSMLIAPLDAFRRYPLGVTPVFLGEEDAAAVKQGKRLALFSVGSYSDGVYGLFGKSDGAFLAVVAVTAGSMSYRFVV